MPVTIKSTGGGSVTVQAPNTASDYTVNFPATNGDMVVAVSGAVPASQGGTGQTSLTANNVILGNGTSAVQFVAPGSNGNVLTSNGTTWTSSPGGGVTSLTAGSGITVSASTGAVTVSQDFYTGSSSSNTSYPIGSYISAYPDPGGSGNLLNSTRTLYCRPTSTNGNYSYNIGAANAITGTWRMRGPEANNTTVELWQRVA